MRHAIILGCLALFAARTSVAVADDAGKVDFARDVEPLFRKNCYSCHGIDAQEGGFRLDSRSDAFAGGDRGKAIVPQQAGKSLLIELVTGANEDIGMMPPEGEGPTKKLIR